MSLSLFKDVLISPTECTLSFSWGLHVSASPGAVVRNAVEVHISPAGTVISPHNEGRAWGEDIQVVAPPDGTTIDLHGTTDIDLGEYQGTTIRLWFSLVATSVSDSAQDAIGVFEMASLRAQPNVHYVSLNGLHLAPFTTWAGAATNIQAAVDVAAPGDTVLVADGTYGSGFGYLISEEMGWLYARVSIGKPITVRSVNGAQQTTIQGQFDLRCVALAGPGAILAGFTIRDGLVFAVGGGVYSETGGVISNCVIVNNRVTWEPWPVLSPGTAQGGGVYGGTLYDCILSNNVANNGNHGNSSACGGGCYGSTLYNCIVWSNKAEAYSTSYGSYQTASGGGAAASRLYSCLVVGNEAQAGPGFTGIEHMPDVSAWGGGASGGTLYNCTLAGNAAYGTAVWWPVPGPLEPEFDPSGHGGGVSGCTVYNSVVVGNISNADGSNCYWSDASFSCTTPDPGGTGNITQDPQFVNAGSANYRLRPTSPCIDAGANQPWMTTTIDLDHHPRIRCGVVDMGVFEFVSTNPPSLICPSDIVLDVDPGGCTKTNVSYSPMAADNCPDVTVVCIPPSGSTFPKGVSSVACTATSTSGNTANCSFTVTIRDTRPPQITCPANIVADADAGQCSKANVTYTATLTDNCPGVTVACSPPSGSTFAKGTTTVTCTATDSSDNTATCSFSVTIRDAQPPQITCPGNLVVDPDPGQSSKSNVTYTATASDNCPSATVTCMPPSGSTFPVGVTTVNCTATDTSGNTSLCSFTVSVQERDGPLVCWGAVGDGQCSIPWDLTNAVTITAGYSHSLALKGDGTVAAWGANSFDESDVPVGLSNVTAVAAGWGFNLALKGNGTVQHWGWNANGLRETASSLSDVTDIATGWDHALALKRDGTVVAWGSNTSGQTNVPPDLKKVLAIAAGGFHSLALQVDGTVIAWGRNSSGQTNVPLGLANVTAIAGGGRHSLALKADGTVLAWGAGTNSSGSSYNYGQSVVPPGLTNGVAISGGCSHSLVMTRDGTVVAWGDNSSGQTNVPVILRNVTDIAAGGFHNLALIRMKFSNVSRGQNGELRFTVLGFPGHTYHIQTSTNLTDWQTIGTINNVTGTAEYTDPAAPNHSRCFYRCVLP